MIKKILSITLIAVFAIAFSINGFAQETLKKVAERGELRVGMTANQPPFTMKAKDGSVIGYEADLANMLAAAMGVKLTIVETPFPELLNALETGKVDVVMSGMTMTFERNMKVAFALYPASLQQLIDIADTGNIMPPKTTWFEPKLRSGLVIHKI